MNLSFDLELPPIPVQPRRFFIRVLKGYGLMASDTDLSDRERSRFVAQNATGCVYEPAEKAHLVTLTAAPDREMFMAVAPRGWRPFGAQEWLWVFAGETGDTIGEGGADFEAALHSANALAGHCGAQRFYKVLDCCVAAFGRSPRYDLSVVEGETVKRDLVAQRVALAQANQVCEPRALMEVTT